MKSLALIELIFNLISMNSGTKHIISDKIEKILLVSINFNKH